MKKQIFVVFLFCLFFATQTAAQLRQPVYLSQFSYGPGVTFHYKSIVIGNINNDGVPDVVFTAAESYQVAYGKMVNGKIKFEMQPIQFFRHGWWYYNGQLYDFDKDGDDDFITTGTNNWDFVHTFILENTGDRLLDTFRNASPPFAAKAWLLFGKFNNDDEIDLFYRVTTPTNPGSFLQDGQTGQVISVAQYGNPAGDLNGDGLIDFQVTLANSPTYNTQTNNYYLNNGDYTFDRYETTGYIGTNILDYTYFGDFDGDGIKDMMGKVLFTSNMQYALKTNMKSQNQARHDTLFVSNEVGGGTVFIRDMTGDGTEDLILFSRDSLFFCESDPGMKFNIQRMAGSDQIGTFASHPDLPPGTVIALSDDTQPMLLYFSYDDSTGLHYAQDYNAFSPFVLEEDIYATPMTALDRDADGLGEICIASGYTVSFAEIQADSTLDERACQEFFHEVQSNEIASGDWNGDGHKDLIMEEHDKIYVSIRQTDGSLSARNYLTEGELKDVQDFDKNGFADLLVAIFDSNFVLFNENGAIADFAHLTNNLSFGEFAILDPNADGFLDVALSNSKTFIFMNDGQRHFSKSPLEIPASVAYSTIPQSPYLMTTKFTSMSGQSFYQVDLNKISPDGAHFEWITGHVFIDTSITHREAWLVNYDGDSMPDMLFNYRKGVTFNASKAVLVDNSGWVAQVLSFPNTTILACEDVNSDGRAEVVWLKGSQVFLENNPAPKVSSVRDIVPQNGKLTIYPNPVPADDGFTLEYESDFQGAVFVEIIDLSGRVLAGFVEEKSFNKLCIRLPSSGLLDAFIVRVSDEKRTASKMVAKF